MIWILLAVAVALLVLFFITKERKARQVAIQKTSEQIAIERMHAERARNMKRKGGKRRGR